jgi:hypothetical protein
MLTPAIIFTLTNIPTTPIGRPTLKQPAQKFGARHAVASPILWQV